MQFTDQSTGAITAYLWDFGDGSTSSEQNPLHTYASDGTYTVTLTVGIADGRTDSHSQNVTVATPISAAFSAQINGLDVQFTNQSTGAVASITWDFGDGATSNDVNQHHTYANSGTYTVTLTVGSADGRTDSHSEDITAAAPLVAAFSAQPNGLTSSSPTSRAAQSPASRGTSATAQPPMTLARSTLMPAAAPTPSP